MILWLALIAAQDVPPPPSGIPLPLGAVEILDPIAPAVARYGRCIRAEMESRGALPAIRPATYRRDVEASIAACAAVKERALAEADLALSRAPDYRDAARRQQAIRHAFDGTEHQQRELLNIMDALRRERRTEN